jgi:hypothetical protein
MGINVLTNREQQIITTTSNGVTAGDLVTHLESGRVARTNTTLGVTGETVTTAGASALRAVAVMEATGTGWGGNTPIDGCQQNVEFANGEIGFVYAGNGTTNTTNINFRVRNVRGADVIPRTIVSTNTNIDATRMLRVTATTAVIAWGRNTSNDLQFMLVNNDGTTAVAAQTVSGLSAGTGSSTYWNVAVCPNGDIVFAYYPTGGTDLRFKRYDSSGVLIGSETTIEAASNPRYISVLGCANNDVVFFYYRNATTAAYKAARYNASNTIQGSLVTVLTGANPITAGDTQNLATELSNGNLVFFTSSGDSASPDFHIYTSAMALVRTIDLGTTTTEQQSSIFPCCVPEANGFALFCLASGSSNNTTLRKYTNDGLGVTPTVAFTMGGTASSGQNNVLRVFSLGSAGYAVARQDLVSGPAYGASIASVSPTGVLNGTQIVTRVSGTTAISNFSALLHSTGVLVLSYLDGLSVRPTDGYYHMQRRSLLGVAAETAPAGSNVRVLTQGTYTINQSMDIGGAFDSRTAVVPGGRGTITGTTAVLGGIV